MNYPLGSDYNEKLLTKVGIRREGEVRDSPQRIKITSHFRHCLSASLQLQQPRRTSEMFIAHPDDFFPFSIFLYRSHRLNLWTEKWTGRATSYVETIFIAVPWIVIRARLWVVSKRESRVAPFGESKLLPNPHTRPRPKLSRNLLHRRWKSLLLLLSFR